MPTVADYDIVSDGSVTIGSPNNDHDFPLGFDQDINLGVRSVLSYMIDPGPLATVYTLAIVNSDGTTALGTFASSPAGPHARQEVIDANVFKKTGNILRIQVTVGSAKFSDIVLMHQSNV
jgi:hypothetical protein